eukprot:4743953-Prymnesium_polylepis.1
MEGRPGKGPPNPRTVHRSYTTLIKRLSLNARLGRSRSGRLRGCRSRCERLERRMLRAGGRH